MPFFENKNYDSAIKCFADSISIDPDNPTFYNNKGLALYHRGDVDEALADLNEAIARIVLDRPTKLLFQSRKCEVKQEGDGESIGGL